jgi:hypothetical protein
MPTFLPRDDDGDPIPVLPYRAGAGWIVQIGPTPEVAGPFTPNTRMVTLRAIGAPVYWVAGAANTTTVAVPAATGAVISGAPHYLPAGEAIDVVLQTPNAAETASYVAAISAAGAAGTLYISERG